MSVALRVPDHQMSQASAHRPLGVLARQIRDAVLPEQTDDRRYVALEHVDSGDISIRRSGRADEARSSKFAFKPGDVLYGKLRPYLDKAVLADFAGVASTEFIVLRASDSVDPAFLAFTMHSARVLEHARATTAGVNHPRTSWDALSTLAVYAPPLDEQQRIAQILSTILSARNSATMALAAARVLKNSALRSLLHEGLETQSREMVKTAVGQIPANWHVKRLGELFEVQLGKMLSPKARVGRNPQPYLRNQDVQWGRINTSGLATMDFGERELSKFELRPGDVLVCEGGEVGRAAIWRGAAGSCYYQKALHRLRPLNGEMNPEFLAYQLMDAFLISKVHGDVTTTTTIAHLPAVKLRALPVPVPPIEEQRKIVAVLTSLDRDIECRSNELNALGVLFDSAVAELFGSAK